MNAFGTLGFGAMLLACLASPAVAQKAAPLGYAAPAGTPDGVVTLSPAERTAAIEGSTGHDSDLPINGLSRGIHGEMGVEIGSRGTRATYGTVAVPLGDSASASFAYFTGTQHTYRSR